MATIDTIADRSTGSAIAGKAYFETSTNKFIVYNGSAWIEIDSDGTGAVFENRWGASFDGSNDYLDCGNDSSLAPASMTVSAWFKASGTVGTFNYIMSKSGAVYGSIHLRYTSANKFNIFLGLSGGHRDLTFNTAQTLTDWHHVAVTYDGADVKGYVDGVNDLSVAATGAINYTANSAGDHLWIGKGPYPDKAEGLIDDAAIFSTALSAADITKIYNSGVPTNLTDAASYDTDRTSNLKGYWRMGDDSNDSATSGGSIATITDSSGNGNDAVQATASNQPTFKALAQSTTSLSFDGSDDNFNIPHNTDFNSGEHTISLWLKASSFGGYRNLIAKDTNGSTPTFRIMLNENKVIYYNGSLFTNTTTLSTGTWYHIAASQSNTNDSLVIYINGVAQSFTNTRDSQSNTADVLVGQWNSNYYFAGLIDEVSMFDSVLSASEVASLAASRGAHVVNDLSLSPVGYYRMGEDDSLTDGQTGIAQITDASGNGNHATQATASSQPTASVPPVIYV